MAPINRFLFQRGVCVQYEHVCVYIYIYIYIYIYMTMMIQQQQQQQRDTTCGTKGERAEK